MSVLPGDYPPNDGDWGAENEGQWYQAAEVVRAVFEESKLNDDAYDISAERFDAYSVDVAIDPQLSPPEKIYLSSQLIREKLKNVPSYWRIRLWVRTESKMGVWLEIDRYGVYVYLGKKEIEQFESLSEFYRHYWGTDFGIKL